MEIKKGKFNLAGEVEYSDNSIVSRTIVKNSGGNITLFAFDKGEELSEHTAPFDAVVSVTDGWARITIGGEANDVNAGETIIMPAGIPHSVKALERFKMMLIMIKG